MTPEQFLAASEVAQWFPGSRLVRNQVGNLTIEDQDGRMLGWVDLSCGEVEFAEQG